MEGFGPNMCIPWRDRSAPACLQYGLQSIWALRSWQAVLRQMARASSRRTQVDQLSLAGYEAHRSL